MHSMHNMHTRLDSSTLVLCICIVKYAWYTGTRARGVLARVKFALSMQKTKVHSLEHVCPNGGLQGRSAQWYVIGSHPVVPTSCALVTKDG